MLLSHASKRAWSEIGMLGIIITLIVSSIVKFITTPPPRTSNMVLGGDWKMAGFTFLGIVILVAIIYALIGSKDEYNKQVKQIQKWEENVKAELSLIPGTIVKYKNDVFNSHLAMISVNNNEKNEVTDCIATLITIKDLGYRGSPEEVIKQRLKWEENQLSDDNCKTILPPLSKDILLHVVETNGKNFKFCCCPNSYSVELENIYLLKIRIDGKIKGINIEPIHFYGVLHIENKEITMNGKPTGEIVKTILTFSEIANER